MTYYIVGISTTNGGTAYIKELLDNDGQSATTTIVQRYAHRFLKEDDAKLWANEFDGTITEVKSSTETELKTFSHMARVGADELNRSSVLQIARFLHDFKLNYGASMTDEERAVYRDTEKGLNALLEMQTPMNPNAKK